MAVFKHAATAGWMAIAMIPTPSASAAMLQGEQRTDVIASSAGSCLDNNVKSAENRPYTLAVVNAFCTCVGTAVVDGFTIEELSAAGKQMTAEFEKRRDAMSAKCSAATFGKARPQGK